MTSIRALYVLPAIGVSLVSGCGGQAVTPTTTGNASSTPKEIVSEANSRNDSLRVPLSAKSGSKLVGTASFTEVQEGVRVVIEVTGIPPGKHATHIHENGDCSAADATSAGDHFNPEGHQHGLPFAKSRHIGDLGNIDVADDGKGRYEILSPGANLKMGDARSYVNRAIIVHDKVDDGGQPSGNAGIRIGCGVIRR